MYIKRGTPLIERIKLRALPKENGCWEWQGALDHRGYGRILVDKRNRTAHRMSWEAFNGKIPDSLCVCHHCDNPRCVNPSHLFLGSERDNQLDSVLKKRNPRAAQTHCKRGHELFGQNLRLVFVGSSLKRRCVLCTRMRDNRRYYAKRSK